jgi:menaquinone-dependent protoporphyrinogen oxidase
MTMAADVLIIYGTTHGHTAKIAAAMADALRGAGMGADVVNATHWRQAPAPDAYRAVIVAASVVAGNYQRGVRRWVRAHAAALRTRPSAFVSVCLGVLERKPAVDAQLAHVRQRFFETTGWQPSETKVVAGSLPYTKYNWLTRRMMVTIVRKGSGDTDTSRDYEYTDWDDVHAFVRDFVQHAGVAPAVSAAP